MVTIILFEILCEENTKNQKKLKMKNLFFVLFTWTFAISSAVATRFMPSDGWVKARLIKDGRIRCVNTGKTCSNLGSVPCMIAVPTLVNGGITTASTSGPVFVYQENECETVLFDAEPLIHTSTVQTYELIP
jgi:hypothetical protein